MAVFRRALSQLQQRNQGPRQGKEGRGLDILGGCTLEQLTGTRGKVEPKQREDTVTFTVYGAMRILLVGFICVGLCCVFKFSGYTTVSKVAFGALFFVFLGSPRALLVVMAWHVIRHHTMDEKERKGDKNSKIRKLIFQYSPRMQFFSVCLGLFLPLQFSHFHASHASMVPSPA